jgi:dipeptidase
MKIHRTKKIALSVLSVALLSLLVFTGSISAENNINVPEGCTTFAAHGAATASGGTLLAKNRDRGRGLCGFLMRDDEGSNRFIGAAFAGQPDTISFGCNEKGVCYTLTWIDTWDIEPNGIDSMVLGGMMLEEVSSAEEGIEYMKYMVDTVGSCPGGWDGTSMMIGDPNEFWVIELSGHNYGVRGPFTDTWFAHTNHYLLPEMIPFGFAPGANSVSRQLQAEALMTEYEGSIDIPILIKCLKDIQDPVDPISRGGTIEAGVMVPGMENADLMTVMWSALGESQVSGFVPLYLGINDVPQEFQFEVGDWQLFEDLRNEAIADPADEMEKRLYIEGAFSPFESSEMAQIQGLEKSVTKRIEKGKFEQARQKLTEFSNRNAKKATKIAERLYRKLATE